MVQDRETRICRCPSQFASLKHRSRSNTPNLACTSSKYSTLNFVSSHCSPPPPPPRECCRQQRTCVPPSPRITCQSHSRSPWDICTGSSSCLVGIMKFIQQQCYPKKKHGRSFLVIHDDVLSSMRQLKCDLDIITDMQRENAGKLCAAKSGDCPKKILTRMACKIYEIEDRLMNSNVLTCNELLAKRKFMIALIKNLQKTIGCYLEGEFVAMRDRQAKLCNLLKVLQCMENEFRCITKGIKAQCCTNICDKGVTCTKSNMAVDKLTKKKSCLKASAIPAIPCTSTTKLGSSKNYEVTGVDVVYTKSTIKTLDPCYTEDDCNCDGGVEEDECIDKQIACHIPACGEPVCEVKICDGNETLQLCDSQPLKDVICQMSQVWQESAKQLINAFHSC